MLQTLKPNNNIYNGTVFELNNNNDFVQKIYLNDISIDTFIKNIDETNNYIAFIRRVSIKQYEKNPYWFNNGPNIEYHLCILRIPPGFYDTVESCIDVINRTYIENTSNLFKEDSSDLYYARKQDYLLKIIDDALVFNPTIYAFPIFFDKMVYTDKTSFDIKLKDVYQPSEVMQNILALTNTVQNFGITNIYNYLLNYYNNINDMSGLIDFSLSETDIFTKFGVHRYSVSFNQNNIAFNNNKPIYLIKGSNYCEYLFIGSVTDVITTSEITYNNIDPNIFSFDNVIQTSIISRPYPVNNYQTVIDTEEKYKMQVNVDVMSISNVSITEIAPILPGSSWADIKSVVENINPSLCPYSYFYKTDDITYLDIYGSDMNDVKFQTFKQYSKHKFNYTIGDVFNVSYAPTDNGVIEYSVPGITPNRRYNMNSGIHLTELPPSVINDTININVFYENSYTQSLKDVETITFTCENKVSSNITPFSTQLFVTDVSNYTHTKLEFLDGNSKNIVSIDVGEDKKITVRTIAEDTECEYGATHEIDCHHCNEDLILSVYENIMVDVTFCYPYLFVSSTYKNNDGQPVFETYGLLRTSVKPDISIGLEVDKKFAKYNTTINGFVLNDITPIEKYMDGVYTYTIYNYFDASIKKFKQNYTSNLHPSDKLYVYYSFDKNIDTILNNTSLKSEQVFSLLATIDMESILKPYATYTNNVLTYDNPVHHIQQNINKTLELLPYTTLYIYITSDDLRYPLFKSDYILSYEIL